MTQNQYIALFWFRRDLRLEDNHALFEALMSGLPVLPIFIFDSEILDKLENQADRRVSFINEQLLHIKNELNKKGSDLKVFYGEPKHVFEQVFNTYKVHSLWLNRDYEPYARKRDADIEELAKRYQIQYFSFKDQLIFDTNDVLKDDGKPYTVFTPYSKKWKTKLNEEGIKNYPSEDLKHKFLKLKPEKMLRLEDIGFSPVNHLVSPLNINIKTITSYAEKRDYPAMNGTSRLSVHLRFGTISIRKLVTLVRDVNAIFLNELIWREFYMAILWHFPHVETKAFKPAYNFIPWRNNEQEFEAWCKAETGYPIVDAAMTELNQTGFMHNRARMIVASFLCKHLLIDWRWGEAWFAQHLTDYELSSNNGGWQWAAGTGCDAAPYFRVFNPYLQTQKFDPKGEYISRWLGDKVYLKSPIVEHKMARERALSVYKETLEKHK